MKMLTLPFWDFFKDIWPYKMEFNTESYAVCVVIMFASLVVIFLVAYLLYSTIYDFLDDKKATTELFHGKLVDKQYCGTREMNDTGTVITSNMNGGLNVGVVSTTSYVDEEFIFFVQSNDTGSFYKVKVDMQQFYTRSVGDAVKFEVVTRGLSKTQLHVKLI